MRIVTCFCSRILLFFVLLLGVLPLQSAFAAQNQPSPLSFYPVYAEPPLYYLRQADLNNAPHRQDLLIKAAISHIQNHELSEAKALLASLNTEPTILKQLNQAKLLSARIALLEQQPKQAIDMLYALPPYLPHHLMVTQHDLLAQAYDKLGEHMLSIEQRLVLSDRLQDRSSKEYNNQTIWQSLQHIPEQQIHSMHDTTNNPNLKAWLSAALMKTQHQDDPAALEQAIRQWQQQYPRHQALNAAQLHAVAKEQIVEIEAIEPHHTLTNTIEFNNQPVTAATTGEEMIPIPPRPRTTIAVLLPKRGDFAPAAKAIEQGIINAYYQEDEASRPIVQFYDSSHNVRAAYQRALQQGAQFVIGPLSKNNANELYRSKNFPVKTLVLNDLPYHLLRRQQPAVYQFSLSNEDEAYQTALRAFQDNRINALIIRSDKSWGQKMDDAFSANFQQFGGTVLERLTLKSKEDPAQHIKKLLQYQENPTKVLITDDEEDAPAQQDEIALSEDMDSESQTMPYEEEGEDQQAEPATVKEKLIHHRTDVDMIFLALSPQQAQRVIPLLKFYYAKDIPVYTTSLINSAHVNEKQDFDGTIFCDMPWILSDNFQSGILREALQKLWPNSTTSNPRLFAFGADAYRLARALQNHEMRLHHGLHGHTGILSLVNNNKIYRQLFWAQFKNGQFQLLDDVSAQ